MNWIELLGPSGIEKSYLRNKLLDAWSRNFK